ncbi:hypothetical protein A8F94_17310 [Bacillus sp. FJAT-27225]|uniref:hypothetical protein n=1 Tax=Bacillus sp. FJAT-27225 TaxID=1743144 RepID=UPI00080C307C|nr:hypothetical protein [Bacillus sp. FJAT-27225]OCA84456.1 hypothetical protein A8F94_17310 [Bacillus sp. FJAT-27225]
MRFVGIDPASKTGFVALDETGEVVREKELTGVGGADPKRMVTLINEIIAHVKRGDVICIEGFPFDTQRAMFAGGLHHGIRNELYKREIPYIDAAPNAVKKFVGVTGWEGEKGQKVRLRGSKKKSAIKSAVSEVFNYTNPSDNVVDAYILARIAREVWFAKQGVGRYLPKFQLEVIDRIVNPVVKEKVRK